MTKEELEAHLKTYSFGAAMLSWNVRLELELVTVIHNGNERRQEYKVHYHATWLDRHTGQPFPFRTAFYAKLDWDLQQFDHHFIAWLHQLWEHEFWESIRIGGRFVRDLHATR